MQILKERIKQDGRHIGNGVLKVDSFMNHQIDPVLMQNIGEEFAKRFALTKATKILTVEASGIAPALATGIFLKIPIIYARKHKPITMTKEAYCQSSESATHGGVVELVVSSEYLGAGDGVLIIDDFLSSAKTIVSLVKLIKQSGAQLVGIGAIIEKLYAGGREALKDMNVPIEVLASIEGFDGEKVLVK